MTAAIEFRPDIRLNLKRLLARLYIWFEDTAVPHYLSEREIS